MVAVAVTIGLTPEGALAIVVGGLAAYAAALVVQLGRTLGWGSLRPAFGRSTLREMVVVGLTLHPAAIGLAMNLQVDLLILSAMSNQASVGLYSLAATLAQTVFLGCWALSQSALQTQMEAEPSVAARFTASFVHRSGIVAAAFGILAALAAYPLIRIVYGPDWTASVLPFVILTIATAALTIEGPLKAFLCREGNPAIISAAGCLAVLTNAVLNVALIPPLGIEGAAIGSVVTYWCYTAVIVLIFARATGLGVESFRGSFRDFALAWRRSGKTSRSARPH
jgi:O-antigen/teichoic acid export membrane protein